MTSSKGLLGRRDVSRGSGLLRPTSPRGLGAGWALYIPLCTEWTTGIPSGNTAKKDEGQKPKKSRGSFNSAAQAQEEETGLSRPPSMGWKLPIEVGGVCVYTTTSEKPRRNMLTEQKCTM